MTLPETTSCASDLPGFTGTLLSGARELGIDLAADQVRACERLCALLMEWNQRMNLTAVRQPADIAVKHVLDSMTCLSACAFPQGARVLDIGTGAGFPGLILKIMRPDIALTLLDSTHKKLAFCDAYVREAGLAGVTTVSARAESLAHETAHREAYDVVVARAVAAMRVLAEFCIPFVRPNGTFLAMKGPSLDAEMRVAASAITRLGGRTERVVPFDLPLSGGERAIVVIGKAAPTPPDLPRLYRDIKRSPL